MTSPSLGRLLIEVAGQLGRLVSTYPGEMLLYGVKGAVEVERYHAKARALGVSRESADVLLNEARRELAESFWPFDPTAVASHRLMDQHAALLPPPSAELRDAARQHLTAGGEPFDPIAVDRLARWLERHAQ